MSDQANLWFYVGEEQITERVSSFIPRIGESVGLKGKNWLVLDIQWTFVSPDSVNYQRGIMAHIVNVILEGSTDG